MNIRRAIPKDALTLAQLRVNCWRAAYAGIVPDSFLNAMNAEEDAPLYKLELEEAPYFIVELEEAPIGFIALSASRQDDLPESGEIQGMYLLPAYWEHGYGKAMMHFSIDALKALNHSSAYLWVLEGNLRARRFYEKADFKKTARLKSTRLASHAL